MNKIKIIVDSTCDLNKEELTNYDIPVLPLYVSFSDEVFLDGDIDLETLYKKVEEKNELPKTSARNPGDYIELYTKYIEEGYDILSFTISSHMSSTYQSAQVAAESVDPERIKVIDSQNLSSGIGLLILKACKLREEGKSLNEIFNTITDLIPNVRSQFAVETLEYLHKGGRCSSVKSLVGRLLRMHPVIAVRKGKMDVFKYPLGKSVKGWNAVLETLVDDMKEYEIDLDHIMITHSIAPEGAAYLKEKLSEIVPPSCIMETKAGCVISTHCGAGTIGILYILGKKK